MHGVVVMEHCMTATREKQTTTMLEVKVKDRPWKCCQLMDRIEVRRETGLWRMDEETAFQPLDDAVVLENLSLSPVTVVDEDMPSAR
jgi:hypothetical protein